jgi:hypothetical protein
MRSVSQACAEHDAFVAAEQLVGVEVEPELGEQILRNR